MKKLFLFIIFIPLVLLMTSCDFSSNENVYDDHIKCDNLMTNLVTALANKDADKAKNFFAHKLYSAETFDSDLNDLIEYYNGSLKKVSGMVTTGEYYNDYIEIRHDLEYNVVCDNEIFRFYVVYIEKDSRNSKNIGINNLYVLKKSEDEDPDLRYFGAIYNFEEGIHVAYPHELLEEDLDNTITA